jgi:hypothetical protein
MKTRTLSRFALAAAAGALCLFANENISLTRPSSLVSQADARIGRPLTPMSVAGVSRRHYRRAVVGTAATTGAYRYGRSCYRDYRGVLICR